MAQFGWLSPSPISAEYDLRRCAWSLIAPDIATAGRTVPLLLLGQAAAAGLRTRKARAAVTLIGIDDPIRRAHFLALGFGEVLPGAVTLDELAERTRRVAVALAALPRRRGHGLLQLDLLTREGYVGERRLALHPREFALLWRLAETPGEPVAADALLSEVWQLQFKPETNSLAVHVCRLRAKLAVAGLAQIIHTTPNGAYVLTAGPALVIAGAVDLAPIAPGAVPLRADNAGLDEYVRMVEPLAPGARKIAASEEA